jgi:hypothetical protein
MTTVLPSCAFAVCLVAVLATILERETAMAGLVTRFGRFCVLGRLTRAVDLGHHKTAEDHLVEGGIGTACRC